MKLGALKDNTNLGRSRSKKNKMRRDKERKVRQKEEQTHARAKGGRVYGGGF